MKKGTKIICLVLTVMMVFSFLPMFASAGILTDSKVDSVESLIQNDKLANIVDWLLKNLSASKENITGTVLRLVFTFMNNDEINAALNGKDPTELKDEEAAKILLDWLDKNLPEWTKDLQSSDNWGTIQSVASAFGVTLKLNSCNEIAQLVVDVCNATVLNLAGDLRNLNGDKLTKTKKTLFKDAVAYTRGDVGDLKFVYNLIDWVEDNSSLIEKFVKGGIGSGGLSIGTILNNIGAIKDALSDINTMVKNVPTFAKGYLYLLIDGHAETPDIKSNPDGGLNESGYAGYTADQLLAAALIRLIEGKDPSDVIAKGDCDAALNMSVYELLATYGPALYNKFAIEPLNTTVKDAIKGIVRDYPDAGLDKVLNTEYNFPENLITKADLIDNGVIGSFNNILVKVAEVMLTADTYKALDLKTGTNDEALNDNLTKICRAALPVFNNDSIEAKLGFKFDQFTADSVKDMALEDMAVAVLKIFFPTWFGDACKADDLAAADTLEKLGVLTVYYTYTKYLPENVQAAADVASMKLDLAAITDAEKAEDTVLGWSGKTAAAAIASVDATRYTMPADATTYDDYFDSIVSWAVGFVKGLPAAAVEKDIYNTDKDYFYKANVVLNAMFDLDFINGMNDGFVVDLETLIFDGLLGNILDFNVAGLLDLFQKNDAPDNFLNKTTIKAVLQIVDKALTSLFKMEEDPSTAAPAKATEAEVMYGDVDGNENIDIQDARLALRRAIMLETYAEGSPEYIACDVDGVGGVTVTDARLILRVAIKLDNAEDFPVAKK